VLPVDTRLQAVGGVVFRRARGEIVDAQIERDVAALNAELAELEAELDQAAEEAKAKLQAKIDAAKAKLQAMRDGIKAKIETSQQETDAKVKSARAGGQGAGRAESQNRGAHRRAEGRPEAAQ
jgi:hypothetical protein